MIWLINMQFGIYVLDTSHKELHIFGNNLFWSNIQLAALDSTGPQQKHLFE